ncbi:MAG: DEAD/DEAH box helicase [Treponema sp.]|jgi:superfamily II DNA/RNA helicase|nr:DEAD/DEAH box helicase [Treponema sp.]
MCKKFENLSLTSFFIKKLEERGTKEPTDIQSKIMPVLSKGESVFFTSATGTGKTFAYLLPVLDKLLKANEEPQNLNSNTHGINARFVITSPTLELCTQIKGELDFLLKGTTLRSALVIGSVNPDHQIANLRKNKPDIIVGNPNRLLLLAKKKIVKLNPEYFILDEADRLVSDEMSDETNELCKIIRRESGNGLTIAACSATLNKKTRDKLSIACGIKNIKFIKSDDHEILRDKIEHWAIFSEKRRKDQTLRSLLSALKTGKKKKTKIKALIFTSRGDEAGLILSRLQYHHVSAAGLFGKVNKKPLSGQERREALDSFRQGGAEALVSTDLAARGLDISGITHVIAMDVPSDSEVYIHRSGRTGRAGKRGVMITIGDETQMRLLSSLEKKLKIKIYPKELHGGQVCAPLPVDEQI